MPTLSGLDAKWDRMVEDVARVLRKEGLVAATERAKVWRMEHRANPAKLLAEAKQRVREDTP
jgi:hypothetical protein